MRRAVVYLYDFELRMILTVRAFGSQFAVVTLRYYELVS